MKNSFASSVLLRGIVTGREITKKRLLNAISINPNGLMHRTSPKTSPTEGFPEEASLAKTSPLKENAEENTITKMTILFIPSLRSCSATDGYLLSFPSILLFHHFQVCHFPRLPRLFIGKNPRNNRTPGLPAWLPMRDRRK